MSENKSPLSEPIIISQPPSNILFEYDGPFKSQLAIDSAIIRSWAKLAFIEGNVQIECSNKLNRTRDYPGGNEILESARLPFWGQKLRDQDNLESVSPYDWGWQIVLHPQQSSQNIREKNQIANPHSLSQSLNRELINSLSIISLREKLTPDRMEYIAPSGTKYPKEIIYALKLFMSSLPLLYAFNTFSIEQNFSKTVFYSSILMTSINCLATSIWTDDPSRVSFGRIIQRPRKLIEALTPPIEIDRALISWSYLQWLRLTKQPIVRSLTPQTKT